MLVPEEPLPAWTEQEKMAIRVRGALVETLAPCPTVAVETVEERMEMILRLAALLMSGQVMVYPVIALPVLAGAVQVSFFIKG